MQQRDAGVTKACSVSVQVQILPIAIKFWQAEDMGGAGDSEGQRVGLPLGQPCVTFEQSHGVDPKHANFLVQEILPFWQLKWHLG